MALLLIPVLILNSLSPLFAVAYAEELTPTPEVSQEATTEETSPTSEPTIEQSQTTETTTPTTDQITPTETITLTPDQPTLTPTPEDTTGISATPTPANDTSPPIDNSADTTIAESSATLTPTQTPVEKICLTNEEIKDTINEDWNINTEKGFSETKEKVKLGVKYVFPQENKVSVTFKCLPKEESLRTTLKIEKVKVSDLNLPEGFNPYGEFAYDITTGMTDGDFEYDVTLPTAPDQDSEISYIEKTADEAKNQTEIKTDEIKTIEEGKTSQEGDQIKATGVDHFTIFIITTGSDFSTSKSSYAQGETVYLSAGDLDPTYYYKMAINPPGSGDSNTIYLSTCFDPTPDNLSFTETYALASNAQINAGWQAELRRFSDSSCSSGNSERKTDDFAVTAYVPPTVDNPSLPTSCCGLDIALVIDNSYSIDSSELTQMKNAVKAFVNALSGTPTQFSVTKFATTATVVQGFTADTANVISAIDSINVPTSIVYTNWEDGFVKAQSTFDPRTNPNLIIFASDGNPNRIGTSGTSAEEPQAVAAAQVVANAIKTSGTRILAIGIGSDLDSANLQAISGTDVNTGNILTSDVITTNFSGLATQLADFANTTCGGTLTVRKVITGQTSPTLSGWNFAVNSQTYATDAQGYTSAVPVTAGTYSVTETLKTGYTLSNAVCTGATGNNGTYDSVNKKVSGIQIDNGDIVSCTFTNAYVPVCGDSVINGTEQCDDGVNNGIACTPSYGGTCTYCSALCQNTTLTGPYCGDGIINGTEACDGTNLGGYSSTEFRCNSCALELINSKVTLCHSTGSNSNPYITNEPDKSGDLSGHADDIGPIWYPGITVTWGDIIPSFNYLCDTGVCNYPGLNWTTEGQAVWNNGCTMPTGTIIVHKDVQGPSGENITDTSNTFKVKIDGTDEQNITDNGTVTYNNVLTGNHTITESLVAAGYTLYGIGTTAGAGGNETGLTVAVAGGQTTHVYVTNRQQNATITIHKNVVGPDGVTDVSDTHAFYVQRGGADQKTISETTNAIYTVAPGTYVFTENSDGDYILNSITGDDNVNPADGASVTVGPNGSAELTFVNKQKKASIVVSKVVKDATGSVISDHQTFTVQLNSGNDDSTLADNHNVTYSVNPGGPFAITEISNANYDNLGCKLANNAEASGITLTSNQSITVTCTNQQKAGTISGYKYEANGTTGILGWTIDLYSCLTSGTDCSFVTTTLTDATGFYSFTNLLTGFYQVKEYLDSLYTPIGNTYHNVTIAPNTNSTGNNFSNFKNIEIKVCKKADADGSLTTPADQTIVAGWGMKLYSDGSLVGTAQVTGADGCYTFTNLGPDNVYRVDEENRTGWTPLSDVNYSYTFGAPVDGVNQDHTFINVQNSTMIVKKVMVGGTDSFDFTGHIAGTISTNNGTITLNNVLPGTYNVTESAKTGWDLTGLTCDDTNSTGDVGARKATFNVTAGETVTCTFTNSKKARITVMKYVVNDNGGTKVASNFTMNVTGVNPSQASFPGNEGGTVVTLDPGSYSVDENSDPMYAKSFVGDCSGTVAYGDVKACTIRNDDIAPSLTLNKILVKDNGATANESAWTLTANGGALGTLSGPGAVGSADVVSGSTFKAGTYTLSESGPSGYTASAWTCTNDITVNANNQITLGLGKSTVCSITNDDIQPKLTVTKVVVGSSKPVSEFILKVDSTTVLSGVQNGFNAGAHIVSEYDPMGGNYPDYNKAISGDCTSSGSITLAPGDDKACTITNTRKTATLRVLKNVDLNGDGDYADTDETGAINWQWNTHWVNVPDYAHSGNTGDPAITVVTGNHILAETPQPNFHQVSISCIGDQYESDSASGHTVGIPENASVVCTFVNARDTGTIELKKAWSGTAGQTTLNIGTTANGTDIASTQTGASGADPLTTGTKTVATNTYFVSETGGLSDYGSSLSCTKNGQAYTPGADNSLVVAKDDVFVCTFTNTRKTGTVTVSKALAPTSDSGKFDLKINNVTKASNIGDGGTTGAQITDTGSVTVSEAAYTGTDLANYVSSYSCTNGMSGNGTTVTFTLNASDNVTCTFTNSRKGSITIIKNAIPNDPQDFHFEDYYNNLSAFDLDDDENGTLSNTKIFTNLEPRGYLIEETAVNGWIQSAPVCTGGNDVDTYATPVATADIYLDAGESITCTFTNTKLPTLTVNKILSPVGHGAFDLKIDEVTKASNVGNGGTTGSQIVSIGQHTVSEAAGNPSTVLSDYIIAYGGDCASNGTITLAAGENKTCTITNTAYGSVLITKDVVPNDSTVWDFTLNGTGGNYSKNDLGDNQPYLFTHLIPGSYNLTEVSDSNYTTNIVCNNVAGAPGSNGYLVSVAAGQNVQCVITNTRNTGTIKVKKDVVPNDSSKWDFAISGPTNNTANNIADNGQSSAFNSNTGSYTITETAHTGTTLSNYTTTYSCSDAAGVIIASGSGRVASFTLAKDQDITCTFTNTRKTGTIVVHKDVRGPSGADVTDTTTNFTVNNDNANNQTITDGGMATYSNVPTGDHTIREINVSSNYTLYGISLTANTSGHTSGLTVNVTENNTIHVYVTNKQKQGEIKVVKDVRKPDGSNVSDNHSFTIQLNGGLDRSLAENDDEEYDVNPGTYTISELDDPNYTEMGCKLPGGAPATNFNVTSNQDITITCTNRQMNGTIKVVKDVKKADGTTDISDNHTFKSKLNGGNEKSFSETTPAEYSVVPGNYTITENYDSNYIYVGCTPDSNSGSAGAQVNIGSNQTKTITCVNKEKPASIKIVKDANPNDSKNFTFSGTLGAFILDDDGDEHDRPYHPFWQYPSSKEFNTLNAGSYTITEAGEDNWYLDTVNCTPGVSVSKDINNRTITISIKAGEDVTCTFENMKYGKIEGTKYNDKNGDNDRDGDEEGLGNWTIFLDADKDGVLDAGEVTQNTDNSGADKGDFEFENLKPGDYKICEVQKANWYSSLPAQALCQTTTINTNGGDEDRLDFGNHQALIIKASKVVCEDEAQLPNWGNGAPNITGSTAQNYVNSHEGCTLESGWDFQYGFGSKGGQPGVQKYGDGTQLGLAPIGTGYNDWKMLGTTSGSPAEISITNLEGANKIWVRENLLADYVSFSYPPDTAPGDSFSAEIYCHTDGLNYDNYDFVSNPAYGNTYYCVAFNALNKGTITVTKNVVAPDGITDVSDNYGFDVELDGKNKETFAENIPVVYTVIPGTHTIAEHYYSYQPYTPLGCVISGTQTPATDFTVAPGANVDVVCTNKQQNGTITGYKWNDLNSNQERDCISEKPRGELFETDFLQACQVEPNLSGWTINLHNDADGAPGQIVASTTTDLNGNYSFAAAPGTYWICEVQKAGWEQTYPTENGCWSTQFGSGADIPDQNFGNHNLIPSLTITKANNAVGNKTPGDTVGFTITIGNDAEAGQANNVKVIDLLPKGFGFNSGSWKVVSSDITRGVGGNITGELTAPTYSSPGVWTLGTLKTGEILTLTYTANIDSGQQAGIYYDNAWGQGTPVSDSTNIIFARAMNPGDLDPAIDPSEFVGTEVTIAKGGYGGGEYKSTTTQEVLGASTSIELPSTGEDTLWVIIATLTLALGAGTLITGIRLKKRYE